MELSAKLKDRLSDLIRACRGRRVLVVGDLILDRYIWGDVSRISPEAPVPVVRVCREEVRLGGAGNVAWNVHALGGEPVLLGVMSTDPAGEALERELDRRGLSRAGVLLDLGRPTTVKTRILASNQQVCRVDRELLQPMSLELLKKALRFFRHHLPGSEGVIVSDYGKGFICPRLMGNLLPAARKMGRPVAIDPKFQDFSVYRPATLLTPNLKECEAAAGLRVSDERSLRQAAEALLARTEVDNLLVTRGEAGMTLFRPTGYTRHFPTCAREVFDVTGAGDTVVAVMGLAMTAGANAEEAAVLANLAAGMVVTKLGTAVVTPDELLDAVRQR